MKITTSGAVEGFDGFDEVGDVAEEGGGTGLEGAAVGPDGELPVHAATPTNRRTTADSGRRDMA
jgi:hypothetical protein